METETWFTIASATILLYSLAALLVVTRSKRGVQKKKAPPRDTKDMAEYVINQSRLMEEGIIAMQALLKKDLDSLREEKKKHPRGREARTALS